jgi:hypothetical protein
MNAVDPKSSYKYYFNVLQDHVRNLYAANGLGIICAKKEEFESAKQIFNKVILLTHVVCATDHV